MTLPSELMFIEFARGSSSTIFREQGVLTQLSERSAEKTRAISYEYMLLTLYIIIHNTLYYTFTNKSRIFSVLIVSKKFSKNS